VIFLNISHRSLFYVNYFSEKENEILPLPTSIDLYNNIYGYFLFHKINREITKGLKSDKKKMFAVADWVFDNILQREFYETSNTEREFFYRL